MTRRIERMIELARAHMDNNGVNAAGAYYRMVLKETEPPKSGIEKVARGEACMWFARRAVAHSCFGEATDWYRKATDADPLAVEYRLEYCRKALIPMDMLKNARIEAERATRIDPKSKEAWATLGMMEHALGNAAAAIAAFDRQLELAPDDDIARLDRATIALDTADYKTVRTMVQTVNGKYYGDALNCLAMCAYREGQHEKAIELYDRAIEHRCQDPELATWNKSLAQHSIGDYENGWQSHEARGRQQTDGAMRLIMNRFARPMWNNEPPPARLHLHQEMGFGDAIAMLRYVPLLIERGYQVCIEVNESLVSLVQRSFPQANVVAKAADYPGAIGIPPFDYHVPMLSLPAIFGTTIDTVPWSGPYLKSEMRYVRGSQLRVGLCWSSGIRRGEHIWLEEYGKRKSINNFAEIRPILHSIDAEFVSLHLSGGDELLIDVLDNTSTWDDTAALMASLDLVITVDTSVAHLAGAMGKPTWIMMHTEGSWHWMAERPGAMWNERSPWYPSARLFRQKKPHEWGEVIEQVSAALAEFRKDKAA
jgi:tetratricopeptide (TPR) repeat protein